MLPDSAMPSEGAQKAAQRRSWWREFFGFGT
jgi:hypothetical protein